MLAVLAEDVDGAKRDGGGEEGEEGEGEEGGGPGTPLVDRLSIFFSLIFGMGTFVHFEFCGEAENKQLRWNFCV